MLILMDILVMLDVVYQGYSKLLLDKGKFLRLVKQLNFSSNTSTYSPTPSSLHENIIPPSPKDILNVVFPSNPASPNVYSNNNPLYLLQDLED